MLTPTDANYHRCPAKFVFLIPANLDPAHAAPMLCGGATVFQPLQRHGAGREARDVGVVGLGGLGHFAILFAKAMGANVVAITHSPSKADDARSLGADEVLVSHGEGSDAAFAKRKRSLDLIVVGSSKSVRPRIPRIRRGTELDV
jgi:D-arabinose 1-dehydrogenase-like Zn-dependent alcohol dehydrogenase